MKYIQAMLSVVCLLIVGGAIDAARADDRAEENHGVTLYTPFDNGTGFTCNAVNVSDKTLGVTLAVLDHLGHALSCANPTTCTLGPVTPTTNPTPEFAVLPGTANAMDITLPLGSVAEGAYCAVAVSGTGNRNDVRVAFKVTVTRMIPGTTTPVFVFREVEGH
jgi:hypothetical protein